MVSWGLYWGPAIRGSHDLRQADAFDIRVQAALASGKPMTEAATLTSSSFKKIRCETLNLLCPYELQSKLLKGGLYRG